MRLPSENPNETLGDAGLYDGGEAGGEGLALGCAVNSAGATGCSQAGDRLDCFCTREETALLLSEDWGEPVSVQQVKDIETRLLRYLRRKLLPFARDLPFVSASEQSETTGTRTAAGNKRQRFKEARRLKRQQQQKGRAGE